MRENMDRRSFLKGATLSAALGAASMVAGASLAGCSTAGKETEVKAVASADGEAAAKDGEYSATSKGFFADVRVDMTVKDGLVSKVSIADMGETPDKGGAAARVLETRILEAGGLDGVDTVTGATTTSRAIFRAAEECLQQAGVLEEPGSVVMKPGIYVGEARGFDWVEPVRVKIVVSEDKLESVEVIEKGLNREEPLIMKAAEDRLIPRMVEHQTVTLDAVTGATSVSAGIRSATEDALKKALRAGGSNGMAIHNFYRTVEKPGGSETLDYDIVICGLGGAGSAAAMSAVETLAAAGKKVRVIALEVAGKYGGTASNAGEPFSVNAPRYIERYNNGEPWCDYDSLYEDWMKVYSKGTPCKPDCVKLLMDESGKTVDWLQFDHGFVFTNAKAGFGTNTWLCKQQYVYGSNRDEGKDYEAEYPDYVFGDRSTSVGQYYDRIISDFESLGGEYMLETEAYELLMDASGKTVAGVKARNVADGTEYTINAKAVILCTGGFAGSGDLMERFLQNPEYPLAGRWHLWGMHQNKGKMIASSVDKGAGTYNIDMPPCVHFKTTADYLTEYPCYYRDGLEERMLEQNVWSLNDIPMLMGINANALQVGTDGVRHFNEAGTFAFWAGGPSWFTIYGSDYVDNLAENGFEGEPGTYQKSTKVFGQGGYPNAAPIPQIYEVLETAEARGYVFKADTLEELAEKMGVPADDFVAQVERYEGYCKSGVDEEFGKKDKSLLSQINRGPYYAIKADATPYATTAALDVDVDLNVLASDGTTKIGGLYACGNDSGGVLYTNLEPYAAYGGVALGWAFTSGRLAGANAAEYVAQA